MQDDKPQTEDDFDFDELDDFDDEVELSDESWDEFDDEIESEPTEEAVDQGNEAPTKGASLKKSFLQKNFNIIVISIVVLGGGGWFITQMGGTPQQQFPTAEKEQNTDQIDVAETADIGSIGALQEIEELSAQSNVPPMPAPMNSGLSNTQDATTPSLASPEVLTPMPGPETTGATETKMTDLSSNDTVEDPALSMLGAVTEETSEAENVTTEIEITEAQKLPPTPAPEVEPAIEVEEKPQPQISAPSQLESETMKLAEITAQSVKEQSHKINEFSQVSADLDKKITNINKTLSDKIAKTDQKIDNMGKSISSLEEKLDQLIEKQEKIVAEPVKAQPAKAKQETIKPSSPTKDTTTEPPAQPVKKPKTALKASPEWQLRSAQPGKAGVAEKGSSDVKTVEIGDTLKGIGQITSINQENGKWVVRGALGSISQ